MVIDLSVAMDNRTPAYPGDPQFHAQSIGSFEHDGYEGHRIAMGTHTGTHIDAPSHMIQGGATLDQADVSQFIGRGQLIDAREGFSLQSVEDADIQPGDIVLFHTGMSQKLYEPDYFTNYPVMTPEITDLLAQRGVKLVGVDTCSVDNVSGFPIHNQLLSRDILIIENLTNLSSLYGKDFIVYALPLKLNLDAAPARVIAEVQS